MHLDRYSFDYTGLLLKDSGVEFLWIVYPLFTNGENPTHTEESIRKDQWLSFKTGICGLFGSTDSASIVQWTERLQVS